MNYNLIMEDMIKNITTNNKLLLHVCCAPCSSAVIERLSDIFSITCFFYNPNITDLEEYNKRLKELEEFVNSLNCLNKVRVLEGIYDKDKFFKTVKGLEKEKEKGKRCYKCYLLRLEETARIASIEGFDFFTTTLSLSPYKNSTWINEIGEELDLKYKATYLYSDFKKKNGYKRSIELSRDYGLYRQDYCGCIYSKLEKENLGIKSKNI